VKDHRHGLMIIIVSRTPIRYLIYSTVTGGIIICTPTIPTYGVPPTPPSLRSPLLIRGISTLPQGAQYFEWNFFPKKWVRGGYFINKIFRFFSENHFYTSRSFSSILTITYVSISTMWFGFLSIKWIVDFTIGFFKGYREVD